MRVAVRLMLSMAVLMLTGAAFAGDGAAGPPSGQTVTIVCLETNITKTNETDANGTFRIGAECLMGQGRTMQTGTRLDTIVNIK